MCEFSAESSILSTNGHKIIAPARADQELPILYPTLHRKKFRRIFEE